MEPREMAIKLASKITERPDALNHAFIAQVTKALETELGFTPHFLYAAHVAAHLRRL